MILFAIKAIEMNSDFAQEDFGMLLTQRLVDELIYGEKGNEVVLVKYLDSLAQRTA